MHNQALRAFVLSLAISLPGESNAADAQHQFALKGAGFLPCAIYQQEREKKSRVYYMISGWLEGYLSAHNKYAANTYDVMAFESQELLLGVLGKHCEVNPQDPLHLVVTSIIKQLHTQRVVTRPPMLEIKEGQLSTKLYRETIRRMQAKLAEKGLYKNLVDGRFTDATPAALMAYQSDLDFEPTGFPDQTTLWRLFRG